MFRVRPSSNAGALTCGARKGRERLLPGSCLARRRVPHVNVHAPSAPAGPHSRCNAGGRCARGPLTAGRVDGWACPKAARQGSGHSEHACAWTDSTILQEPANMPSCYPSRHCQPGDRGGPWLPLAYMYVPCIIPMIPHDFHAFPDHCKPVSSRTDTGTGVKQSSAHLPCCWLAPCLLASPSVAIALLSAPGSAAASSACLAAGAFSSAWLSTPRLPDAPAPISAPEPYVGPRAPAPGAQACPGVPASRGSCLPSPRWHTCKKYVSITAAKSRAPRSLQEAVPCSRQMQVSSPAAGGCACPKKMQESSTAAEAWHLSLRVSSAWAPPQHFA